MYRNSNGDFNYELNFVEGFLKPAVAVARYGGLWLGAAGGHFTGPLDQLKSILDNFRRAELVLNPDSGALTNPHIIGQYHRLNTFVASTGRTLHIRWWGQTNKGSDVDEISLDRFLQAQVIGWEQFWAIVPQNIQKQVLEDFSGSRENTKPEPIWLASATTELEQQLNDEVIADREIDLSNSLANILSRFRKVGNRATKQCSAKTPAVPAPNIEVHNTFTPGSRVAAISRAKKLGFSYVLDLSGTGTGKSTTIGTLNPADLGVDTLFYLTQESRKPSTAEIEENYTTLPIKHRGMVSDTDQRTPLGNPVVRHPQTGERPEVQGNCTQPELFKSFAALGINVEGEGNPICTGCDYAQACGTVSGWFRKDRRDALSKERISANPQSLNNADSFDYSTSAIAWEEAGALLQYRDELDVTVGDIDKSIGELYQERPELAASLRSLLAQLRQLMTVAEAPGHYGWNDAVLAAELMQSLIKTDLSIRELIDQVASYYESLVDTQLLEKLSDRVDTSGITKQIASVKGKLERRSNALATVKTELQTVHNSIQDYRPSAPLLGGTQGIDIKAQRDRAQALKTQVSDLQTEIQELTQQLADLKREREIAKQGTSLLQRENRSKKMTALTDSIQKRWLVNFLSALARRDRYSFRLRNGVMTISSPMERYTDIAKAASCNIFLDATLTPDRLAQMLGIDLSEIYVIQQQQAPIDNVDLVQISDMGKCGRQRSESLQERLTALEAELTIRHPGLTKIDYKALGADRYWFRDNRGSNEFQDAPALMLVGTPCPNLGVLEADYIALTGNRLQDDDESLWRDFVHRAINAELIQAIGRLRAQLRREQKLSCYLVTNHNLPSELNATQVNVYDICPQAAKDDVQVWSKITEFCKGHIQRFGVLPTQQQVSAALDVIQSQISKLTSRFVGGWKHLKKIFQTLIDPFKASGIFAELHVDKQSEAVSVSELISSVAHDPPEQAMDFLISLVEAIGIHDFAIATSQIEPLNRGEIVKKLLMAIS